MEVNPRYKRTEVGLIPVDWKFVPIDFITSEIGDGIHSTPKYSINGDYYFINGTNLRNGKIIFYQETKTVSKDEYIKYKNELNDKSLLMSINGTIGNIGFYNFEPVILGKSVAYLNINNSSSRKLIYYLLQMEYVKRQFLNGVTGTTIKNLGLATLRDTMVALPAILVEQETIAKALSDADALIESLEALILKKRQIKQGTMQELLTGQRRLPGLSGEWEVKTLDQLFYFSGGYTASRDQLSQEGYCYLHYGDIHLSKKSFINLSYEFQDIPKLKVSLTKISPGSLLQNGDVVFVDASEDDEGTSRHIVVINPEEIPFISGLHTIVAKSKTNELDNSYRQYCFQTRSIKSQFHFYAVGTKVSGISKDNIGKIFLPVPSISEQQAIAEILINMDDEIEALEEKLTKASRIKEGMMQELLTGRIRLI